jgi:hypothetical protein
MIDRAQPAARHPPYRRESLATFHNSVVHSRPQCMRCFYESTPCTRGYHSRRPDIHPSVRAFTVCARAHAHTRKFSAGHAAAAYAVSYTFSSHGCLQSHPSTLWYEPSSSAKFTKHCRSIGLNAQHGRLSTGTGKRGSPQPHRSMILC